MLIRENKTKCFFRRKKKIYGITKEQSTLKINPTFKPLFSEWSAFQNWIDLHAPIQRVLKLIYLWTLKKKYWEKETAGNSKSLYH